jgi:hypothetical protein
MLLFSLVACWHSTLVTLRIIKSLLTYGGEKQKRQTPLRKERGTTDYQTTAGMGLLVMGAWGEFPTFATLDMDATLIETGKKDALFSYKGYKA